MTSRSHGFWVIPINHRPPWKILTNCRPPWEIPPIIGLCGTWNISSSTPGANMKGGASREDRCGKFRTIIGLHGTQEILSSTSGVNMKFARPLLEICPLLLLLSGPNAEEIWRKCEGMWRRYVAYSSWRCCDAQEALLWIIGREIFLVRYTIINYSENKMYKKYDGKLLIIIIVWYRYPLVQPKVFVVKETDPNTPIIRQYKF